MPATQAFGSTSVSFVGRMIEPMLASQVVTPAGSGLQGMLVAAAFRPSRRGVACGWLTLRVLRRRAKRAKPSAVFQAVLSHKPVREAGALRRCRTSSLTPSLGTGRYARKAVTMVSAASFDVRRPVLDRQANCAKLLASCPFGRRVLPQTSGGGEIALVAGHRLEAGRQQVLGGKGVAVVFGGSPADRNPVRLQGRFDPFGQLFRLPGVDTWRENGEVVANPAGGQVVAPDRGPDRAGDPLENRVAGAMTVGVVHLAQLRHIEHQQGPTG